MYIFRAGELDEKNAAELKATLSKGVLKNHHNDTYTHMQRSNT
jgi:anti-anti-sigma regulatory factor